MLDRVGRQLMDRHRHGLRRPSRQRHRGASQVDPRAETALSQEGREFTRASLNGAPSVVFFGFTNCPDICPTTLSILARARKQSPRMRFQAYCIIVHTRAASLKSVHRQSIRNARSARKTMRLYTTSKRRRPRARDSVRL